LRADIVGCGANDAGCEELTDGRDFHGESK
jgi:hypothetical protein